MEGWKGEGVEGEGGGASRWRNGGVEEGWTVEGGVELIIEICDFKQHFYTTSVAPGAWPFSTCLETSPSSSYPVWH